LLPADKNKGEYKYSTLYPEGFFTGLKYKILRSCMLASLHCRVLFDKFSYMERTVAVTAAVLLTENELIKAGKLI
jgi:hypothetical protein